VSNTQGKDGQEESDLLAKIKLVVNDGIDIFPTHGLVLSFLDGKSLTNPAGTSLYLYLRVSGTSQNERVGLHRRPNIQTLGRRSKSPVLKSV